MKNPLRILFLTSTLLIGLNALASGSEGVGGGDLCEARIKTIRDDIQSWIKRGGAAPLTLPVNVDYAKYSQTMLSEIATAKIRCVGQGDQGYPVEVNNTAKVCRFDQNVTAGRITCDYTKFQAMNESDQYILVHHEYAGLAGIENPEGADSHYEVSNQITGYLVDTLVKKLSIGFPSQTVPCSSIDHSRDVAIGTRCLTNSNHIYQRVSRTGFGEAWKDQDGLIWSERIDYGTHYEAVKICRTLNAMLPSKEEITKAMEYRFGQALKNSDERYWTSQVAYSPRFAYVYNPNGQWALTEEIIDDRNFSIRCLSR